MDPITPIVGPLRPETFATDEDAYGTNVLDEIMALITKINDLVAGATSLDEDRADLTDIVTSQGVTIGQHTTAIADEIEDRTQADADLSGRIGAIEAAGADGFGTLHLQLVDNTAYASPSITSRPITIAECQAYSFVVASFYSFIPGWPEYAPATAYVEMSLPDPALVVGRRIMIMNCGVNFNEMISDPEWPEDPPVEVTRVARSIRVSGTGIGGYLDLAGNAYHEIEVIAVPAGDHNPAGWKRVLD